MGQLILKRASASRPSGEWNDDDYDVLSDGVVVGRIMKADRLAREHTLDVDAGLWATARTAHRRTATRRPPCAGMMESCSSVRPQTIALDAQNSQGRRRGVDLTLP